MHARGTFFTVRMRQFINYNLYVPFGNIFVRGRRGPFNSPFKVNENDIKQI